MCKHCASDVQVTSSMQPYDINKLIKSQYQHGQCTEYNRAIVFPCNRTPPTVRSCDHDPTARNNAGLSCCHKGRDTIVVCLSLSLSLSLSPTGKKKRAQNPPPCARARTCGPMQGFKTSWRGFVPPKLGYTRSSPGQWVRSHLRDPRGDRVPPRASCAPASAPASSAELPPQSGWGVGVELLVSPTACIFTARFFSHALLVASLSVPHQDHLEWRLPGWWYTLSCLSYGGCRGAGWVHGLLALSCPPSLADLFCLSE